MLMATKSHKIATLTSCLNPRNAIGLLVFWPFGRE